jgi:predicted RNase H-like HicB family nuclease
MKIDLVSLDINIQRLPESDGGGYMAFYPALKRTTAGYGETRLLALKDLDAASKLLLESLESLDTIVPRQPQYLEEYYDPRT